MLARAGNVDQGILDILRANVRLPQMALGDLHAGMAAVKIGERGVQELCRRYGADALAAATATLLDQGERLSRAEIARMPDGVYEAEDVIDGDGITDDEIPIRVKVTVAGDAMEVDFDGHEPAGPRPHQLRARRAGVGVQDGLPRDHRAAGAQQRGRVPAVHRALSRGHDVHGGQARADRLVLRVDRVRDRARVEGAGAGAAGQARAPGAT